MPATSPLCYKHDTCSSGEKIVKIGERLRKLSQN